MMIKRGTVIRMNCWICGEVAEAHHENYDDPKDVTWLCTEHHKELHRLKNGYNDLLGIIPTTYQKVIVSGLQAGKSLTKEHGDLYCEIDGELISSVESAELLSRGVIESVKKTEFKTIYAITDFGRQVVFD